MRSYKSYENDEKKVGTLKYNYMMQKLAEINPIDEEHGVIDVEYIKQKCEGFEILWTGWRNKNCAAQKSRCFGH